MKCCRLKQVKLKIIKNAKWDKIKNKRVCARSNQGLLRKRGILSLSEGEVDRYTNRPLNSTRRKPLPHGPGVELDGVGEIGQDHVKGLGIPVVEQHTHRLPGPRPTPAHTALTHLLVALRLRAT
jgi:hypothetical protein